MKIEIEKDMKGEEEDILGFDIKIIPETKEDKYFIEYWEKEDDHVEKFVDKEGNIRFLI